MTTRFRHLWLRVGYRPMARLLHRVGLHHTHRIGPLEDGAVIEKCEWCGLSRTIHRPTKGREMTPAEHDRDGYAIALDLTRKGRSEALHAGAELVTRCRDLESRWKEAEERARAWKQRALEVELNCGAKVEESKP